jgi:hypothetical protein
MSNRQQMLFIRSFFKVEPICNPPIKVSVKHPRIKSIEFYANTGRDFVVYRVHTANGPGLWNSWENVEDFEQWFENTGLLKGEVSRKNIRKQHSSKTFAAI